MAYFEGKTFELNETTAFLRKKIRTRGILKKEPIEEARISDLYWRPFRIVEWCTTQDNVSYTSVVDESLAIPELEPNEELLLWRPTYTKVLTAEAPGSRAEKGDGESINELISNLLEKRLGAQERLKELEPEVRKIQADRRAAAGILLPRTPGGLRKDASLMERRQPDHGLLLASSIVMNIPNSVVVKDFRLGQTVYVGTISAVLTEIESGAERDLHLETPGADSFSSALKNASGLTRICSINGNCRNIVRLQAKI